MASQDHSGGKQRGARGGDAVVASGKQPPDWAGGLKQLYDSVVEEPLPDAFKDLLERLDDGSAASPDRDGASDGTGES